MKQSLFYQIALPVPKRCLFDYLAPDGKTFAEGTRVKVPFGQRTCIGVVMESADTSLVTGQLKTIYEACEPFPLFPSSLCQFLKKTAHYYHHPLGEVVFTGVPRKIRDGVHCEGAPSPFLFPSSSPLILNEPQHMALQSILTQQGFSSFLLDGVTGSGKTEVYLQAAAHFLNQGKQVLILVPEISLTPQTQQRFESRFGEAVVCYHSRLTPLQRFHAWRKIRFQEAQVVIGTRSAIFLPFVALGFIVIDEEHDPSFKQQEGSFRYSARDLGVLRAKIENCPIVLGSATPAIDSLFNTHRGKYRALILPHRATQMGLPEITQLDIRHKKLEGGLSQPLLKAIGTHLEEKGQVLLFINRRGYAPTFMCFECHWMAHCTQCDARLTFHHQAHALICHHCLFQQKAFSHCPQCKKEALHPIGHGTERLENVLQKHFGQFSIGRIDSDAARKKGNLENFLQGAQEKSLSLLIGTQMLAKGHHFPHLTLVGIVDMDGGLFSVDFRAVEHMAQLITQVAGRAGRSHQAGKVLIQTCHPEHPLFQAILHQPYRYFAKTLLKERERCALPPFSYLALLRAKAKHATLPYIFLKEIHTQLHLQQKNHVAILGPVPAPMLKCQGHYHYQLLFQASRREALHQVLQKTITVVEASTDKRRVRWSLDVDPINLS